MRISDWSSDVCSSDLLDSPNVVRMRGDWTLPSDAISAYLAGFGRYGIPFNAVYGPGAPQGLALPEILTRDAVLNALAQAAGGTATSARFLASGRHRSRNRRTSSRADHAGQTRAEERRSGKECASKCRTRGSQAH